MTSNRPVRAPAPSLDRLAPGHDEQLRTVSDLVLAAIDQNRRVDIKGTVNAGVVVLEVLGTEATYLLTKAGARNCAAKMRDLAPDFAARLEKLGAAVADPTDAEIITFPRVRKAARA